MADLESNVLHSVSGVSLGPLQSCPGHVWEFTRQIPLYSHFPEEMGDK